MRNRGLGYRSYNLEKYCPLCKKSSDQVVFILGWGNWYRCPDCFKSLGKIFSESTYTTGHTYILPTFSRHPRRIITFVGSNDELARPLSSYHEMEMYLRYDA